MKKILTIIAATVCATSFLYAQGTVLFDTSKAGTAAKVLEAVGYSGAGSAIGNTVAGSVTGAQFLMQLYGAAGITDSGSLVPLGFPVNARGGTLNGGFSQITGTTTLGTALTTANTSLTIPTLTAGGVATVQLRAWWAGTTGTTYTSYYNVEDTSATAAQMRYGFSSMLVLNATGNPLLSPPGTPVDLIGLQGFQLLDAPQVPEPSTFALLGLGALGMLIFRRK